MKKILAVVLALTMIVGMSLPVFAAEPQEIELDETTRTATLAPVTYTFKKSNDDVLGVNVTWTALTFEFSQGAWDPDELNYLTDAKWDSNTKSADITIENCSNVEITVEATWATALAGATASFKVNEQEASTLTLAKAEVEQSVTGKITATVDVSAVEATTPVADGGNVGTITVTITAPAAQA